MAKVNGKSTSPRPAEKINANHAAPSPGSAQSTSESASGSGQSPTSASVRPVGIPSLETRRRRSVIYPNASWGQKGGQGWVPAEDALSAYLPAGAEHKTAMSPQTLRAKGKNTSFNESLLADYPELRRKAADMERHAKTTKAGKSRSGEGAEKETGIQLQWWHELIAVLITALTISALVRHFLFQPFYIPSQSMQNTLMVNDTILVTKMAPRYRNLNRGDIVVFKDAENWFHDENEGVSKKSKRGGMLGTINKVFIFFGLAPDDTEGFLVKRIIGLPGDYVSCCGADGKLSINGKPIDEGYLPPNTKPSEVEFQVAVPTGHIWVMGDNRQHSADSRHHQDAKSQGFVPISDVVGRAFVMVWPPERIKIISNSCAFYNIPPPVSIGNRDNYSEYSQSTS